MTERKVFQIPAYITGLKSMTNSWRLTIDTNELIKPESIAYLVSMQNEVGWMSFAVHQIDAEDVVDLPPIVPRKGQKSKSKQLRDVFWCMWSEDSQGHEEFNDFYNMMYDKLIQFYKDKLDESN